VKKGDRRRTTVPRRTAQQIDEERGVDSRRGSRAHVPRQAERCPRTWSSIASKVGSESRALDRRTEIGAETAGCAAA
jgi:hypothetical protein